MTPGSNAASTQPREGRVSATAFATAGGARLWAEIRGGVASALVSLTIALTLGLLAYGSLGPDLGVTAAFSAIVFAAPVAAIFGGTPIPGAGARVSATLILTALIASTAADASLAGSGIPRVEAVVFVAAATLALSGLFQIGFGLARLGTLARFVPYPVVAGFMNGVAILIVLAQIPYLAGLAAPVPRAALLEALPGAQPWPLVIGVATAGAIWAVARRWRGAPAALLGLLAGTVLYYILAAALPFDELGPRLGQLDATLALPVALAPLGSTSGIDILLARVPAVLGTAAAIAVIGSLDSLLAAVAVDVAHNTRHDPNRELVGLGLGNVVSGAFGGIPISFSPNLSRAAFQAGARTRGAAVVTAAVLLAVWLLGTPALAYVPLAVLAGIMVVVGINMVDRWTRQLVTQLGAERLDRDTRWSLAVVAAVCIATVALDFVVAVVFGLIASMALFIASMNRSIVRASWSGLQRASRRVYPAALAQRLRERGAAIRILELEGPVFFGTVQRLANEVEAVARAARFIVLDFRRVGMIDATGAVMLEQLSERLAASGAHLFLAHVRPDGRLGRALTQYRTFVGRERTDWFEDTDRALEAAEQSLLADETVGASRTELPLEQSSLFAGLAPGECDRVRACLERRELVAGETLFREGEAGDRLYVLSRGSVTIVTDGANGAQRIGTFEPGVIFGEMAMLDGAVRSATAVADRPIVVYSLSSEAMARLHAAAPELGVRLLVNIARHLSNRLRLTTDTLRSESDAGD